MKVDRELQKAVVGEIPRHVHARDIKRRIKSALQRQAGLDADAITISVDGTTVTLSGVVDSWSERMAAHSSAWSDPGVQNVVDNLSVAD
jgi:osmotically-inducible protein OsmY